MPPKPTRLPIALVLATALALAVPVAADPGWKPRPTPTPSPAPAPATTPPAAAGPWKPRHPAPTPGVVPAQAIAPIRPAYLPAAEEPSAGPELPLPQEVPTLPPPTPVGGGRGRWPAPAALTSDALPAPRRVDDAPAPEDSAELRALLGSARSKVKLRQFDEALKDFTEYLRQRPDNDAVRLEYAGVLISAGRVREAATELQGIARRAPRNTEVRELLGDVSVLLRDYRPAVEQYRAVLELDPENRNVTAKYGRVLTFSGRRAEAARVYERYLADLQPDDPDSPRLQGALLADLERYADAVPYLEARIKDDPDDVELLGFLARTQARLGDRTKAADAVRRLLDADTAATEPRLRVADDLLNSEEFELAAQVYAGVLRRKPGETQSILGLARVQMALFHPHPARQLLESARNDVQPGQKYWRSFVLAWAEYHQLVGEYLEAIRVYKQLLVLDENDTQIRLSLAKVYDFIVEWEKAKAEFSKVPATSTSYREARTGIARVLASQRYFTQAVAEFQRLLNEEPDDADVAAALARTLSKAGEVIEAESVCRGFLAGRARFPSQAVAIRLALGRALYEHGKFVEAHGEYDTLVKTQAGRVPEAYYGLSRSAARIGRAADAKATLDALINLLDGDARTRLQLADLYNADFDDAGVVRMASAVLKFEPDNLAAMIRLADAQNRIARRDANVGPVTQTAQAVLRVSPTNARANLAMARALAQAQDYKSSARQYERLLTIDPDYTIPRRERARVLYADQQFSAASAAYLQSPAPADLQIQADVAALAAKDDRLGPLLTPLARARLSGPELHAAVAKLAAETPDPELQQWFHRVLIDHDARLTIQKAFQLEEQAKSLKGVRNFEAVPVYRELVELEPTSTEARFDLAQTYAGLRQTHNELREYGGLLTVDPLFREASVAAERASLELSPQGRFAMNVFDQTGRNGLASITRLRYENFAILPIGEEDERVRFGYTPVTYLPKDHSSALRGNILSVGLDKRCAEDVLFSGLLNYEIYPDRLSSRPTGNFGLGWQIGDYGRLDGSLFLENVVENGESLRQDIFRGGFNLGGNVRPSRWWTAGGNYRGAAYSDGNWLNEVFLFSDVSLTLPPRQLKLVANMDMIAFNQQSVFPTNPPNPNNIIGTIHPYFAPNGFAIFEGRAEWWHYVSRDIFTHANQIWYSVQFGVAVDTSSNVYEDYRALAQYDVASCLSIGLMAQAYTSPVYTAITGMGYINARFPVRYR